MKPRHIAAVLTAAAAAMPAAAQMMPVQLATLSVSAEGKALRAPDVADLSGGVVTTAATATAALAENATKMTAVVAAVRRAGIAERDIQTSGIGIQPQYRYVQNESPVLTGYQATNTVALRVRKLSDAGKLIDTLVQVGANQISGPTFRVDDSAAALDEARLAAVATAKARAALYAKAAGVRIKRILTISENGSDPEPPRPVMMRAMAMKSDSAADSPIVPGEVALTVNVGITFEIEPN